MIDIVQPAIVPFRHSKLTEMFQSFFVGDGKAVGHVLASRPTHSADVAFSSHRS